MKSNIFDKYGLQVYLGDTLAFPYICPTGSILDEEDFRKQVVFKYGCFGFETETKFIPLMDWMVKKQGDYISNCGNKVIYTEKYLFWIV